MHWSPVPPPLVLRGPWVMPRGQPPRTLWRGVFLLFPPSHALLGPLTFLNDSALKRMAPFPILLFPPPSQQGPDFMELCFSLATKLLFCGAAQAGRTQIFYFIFISSLIFCCSLMYPFRTGLFPPPQLLDEPVPSQPKFDANCEVGVKGCPFLAFFWSDKRSNVSFGPSFLLSTIGFSANFRLEAFGR